MLNSHYIYLPNSRVKINSSDKFYIIPIWDQKCIDYFFKGNQLNAYRCSRKNHINIPEYLNYLKYRFNDSDSICESLWRIKLHIEIRPTCKVCGGKVSFRKGGKFGKYCENPKCPFMDPSTLEKTRKTNQEKYGVDYNLQNPITRKKIKNTCLEKYGVDSYSKTEEFKNKIKEIYLEKYSKNSFFQTNEFKEKSRNTCLEKYGVEFFVQTNIFKEKSRNTCLEKYGKEYFTQTNKFIEKTKNTCLKKYGVEFVLQNKKIREKGIKTLLEKYGVTNYRFADDYMKKYYESRRINDSYKYSNEEINIFNNIKKIYPDVQKQYRSEKYPFNCDFYIPSLDLYIEYQGFWMHGYHAYDNNIDNIELNKWYDKSKKSNQFKYAINIWTKSDPLKRKIAKDNNLNYLELWPVDYHNNTYIDKISNYKK